MASGLRDSDTCSPQQDIFQIALCSDTFELTAMCERIYPQEESTSTSFKL